jgi:hypothetical protein
VVYATLLRDKSFFEIVITADGRSEILDDQITQDIDRLVPVPGDTIISRAFWTTRSNTLLDIPSNLKPAELTSTRDASSRLGIVARWPTSGCSRVQLRGVEALPPSWWEMKQQSSGSRT